MLIINKNKVELIGKITSLSYERVDIKGNKFRFFDIVQNDKLEDGSSSSSFFKIKLSSDLISKYQDLIKVSNNVYINGYLNNYVKNGKTIYYIFPKEIKLLDENYMSKENDDIPFISYDTDGVMLWHGKRCESVEPTLEDKKEMEALLNDFR